MNRLFTLRRNSTGSDESGFDHVLLPLACFVVFALIGSFYLYHSLAATSVQWKGVLEDYRLSSGYCLTTTGSTKASLVELDPCSKTYDSKQVWSLVDVRKATVSNESNVQEFYLQSADGGECIDNWGASKKTSYPEKLYPCSTTDSAVTWIWGAKFTSRGYSSHQLSNMAAASMCLDDRDGSDKSGTYVGLYTCKTTAQSNQEWFEQGAPSSTGSGSGSGGSSGAGSPTEVQGTTCPSPKPIAPISGYTIAACQDFNSGLGDFGAYSGGGSGTVVGNGREPGQCTVSGGYLHLVQSSNGATCGGWMNNFGQQYGLWEVRMRAYYTGSGSGSAPHPVLILWPSSGDWTSELDFFETDLGNSATGYLHCTGSNVSSNCYTLPSNNVDYGQWHVYSILWTSNKMAGYIDGKLWWSSTNTSSFQPEGSSNLTIQLDNLSGSTPVRPGEMDINWAHMFKAG